MINQNKDAALFIICPFCQMENYLRVKYGNHIYFMTATAAVLNFDADEISTIKDFIRKENITDVYLVNDLCCNFIEEAIKNQQVFGLQAEKQLRNIFKEIDINLIEGTTLSKKKLIIAEHNLKKQEQYLTVALHDEADLKIGVVIHTLITNKLENKFN